MKIDVSRLPYKIDTALVNLLEAEVNKKAPPPGSAVTLNFRDPNYNITNGGFHPVEVRVSAQGQIEYCTDFALVGVGEFAELTTEIDFDFANNLFIHFGQVYPLSVGNDLYTIWQENFTAYHSMGVFKVECVIS